MRIFNSGVQPSDEPGNCTPAYFIQKCGKTNIFPSTFSFTGGMGNHKGLIVKSRYRRKNFRFSTLIRTVFRSFGEVTGTDNHFCLGTLLAITDAGLAERIVLPSAIISQEESPLQPPFFTAAHKSPCSGTSRPGCFPSGDFCLEHSFFAASSRSRMEDFPWDSSRRPLLITPSIIP